MLLLTVLSYRWAGWRIVPYSAIPEYCPADTIASEIDTHPEPGT